MDISRRKMMLMSAAAGTSIAATSPWLNGGNQTKTNEEDGKRVRPKDTKPTSELFNEETETAVKRALAYLSRKQVQSGPNRGTFGSTGYSSGVAVCGLSGLAFMCGGNAPGEGTYGKHVDRCCEFLMKNTQGTGYISRIDNSVHENMYGHGFAMLFMAEAYGMTLKTQLGEKLEKAVDMTCRTQNTAGGWRYQPRPQDADLSITVCQIMGLRAARDAGVNVSDEVRKKCIDYVKNSYNAGDGSFRYTIGGHSTFAMTAAGVTSLYSAGIYDGDMVKGALKYLDKNRPPSGGGNHYFYGQYYAVQAMWHAGGEYWNNWYPAIRDHLLKKQASNGSWSSSMAGSEFGTAMACIILQIPLNYLPVFSP